MNKALVDDILSKLSGSSFVGLDTATDVKLSSGGKNPHQNRIKKIVTNSQVMVFTSFGDGGAYENMVRRRLEKEGRNPDDFVLSDRAWGTRIPGTAYVEHKGEYYLEVIFVRSGEVQYTLDGNPIDQSDIIGLPKQEINPDSQTGLSNKVILRTYKLSNITGIRAFGKAAHL